MNCLKPDPSKESIVSMIKRNDLSELMEFQIRYGVGSATILNFNWHLKNWIKANLDATTSNSNTVWWIKRILVMDAILKHPDIVTTSDHLPDLPPIEQQLTELY